MIDEVLQMSLHIPLLQAENINKGLQAALRGSGSYDDNLNWLTYILLYHLLPSLAVLIGWIGSIRIYLKWHYGEPVIGLIRSWGLSLVFVSIVTTIINIIWMGWLTG